MFETLLQDLRIGWRSLARTPGFTAVVVLVLALGIGANTMIFNVANAFLFRPLPYVDMQRNMLVRNTEAKHDIKSMEMSVPDFLDLRERSKSFERMAAYSETQAYMTLGNEPERFEATWVSPGLFAVYHATPILGREFLPEEEVKERALAVIMISHRVWQERFKSDPNIIGRTVKMNGRVREIVGVAPPEFRFPEIADFFIPVYRDDKEDPRAARYLDVAALLKPGVSQKQAKAEVAAIGAALAKEHPKTNEGVGMRLMSYREFLGDDMGPILSILMAAVGFVLLIACANVANLMLARGAGRQKEIALRFALGATRGRIVRQLLTESLIVAALGGAFGLLFALWGRDLTIGSIPMELPFWMKFDLDPNTIGFLVAVSIVAAVMAGLVPALQTSQVDVHEALKEGGQHGTAGRGRNRLRSALVVAEIALALVLLAGAGLMIRSFVNMTDERSAIRPDGVMTARFTMPIAVYPNNASKLAFMDRVMPAIAALPGVQAASVVQALPLGRNSWTNSIWIEGDAVGKEAPSRLTYYGIVRPKYFEVMGLRLVAGRDFNAHDDSSSMKVAIISESAAKEFWPGKDPIGQRFKWGAEDTTGFRTVVGVVSDVRQHIELKRPPSHVYVPHMQEPVQSIALVVKHAGDPAALATAMRRTVQSNDADMPLFEVRTMNEWLRYSLWENRIYVSLMGVFAVLALLIAAIGIYGVMAYSVAQRTQEIGIRMALGAAREDVIKMVVGQAFRLTVLGVGIGLAGAYGVTRLMASVLFGVSATDPPTFIGVTVILAFSALVAAWVPADRATRVDPMIALRSE